MPGNDLDPQNPESGLAANDQTTSKIVPFRRGHPDLFGSDETASPFLSRARIRHYEAPLVWVMPENLLETGRAAAIAIAGQMGHHVWELSEGSIAIEVYGPCAWRGKPLDSDEFVSRIGPLSQAIRTALGGCAGVEDVEVPDTSYWLRFWLSAQEVAAENRTTMQSSMEEIGPVRVCCYRPGFWSKADGAGIARIVAQWHERASNEGFQGQCLGSLGEFRHFAERMARGKAPYGGLEFDVNSNAVTWPWVELYLQLRRELPDEKRVSIQFSKGPGVWLT